MLQLIARLASVVNLDIYSSSVFSCLASLSFYGELVYATTWPLLVILGLALLGSAARRGGRESQYLLCVDAALKLSFLVFPMVRHASNTF